MFALNSFTHKSVKYLETDSALVSAYQHIVIQIKIYYRYNTLKVVVKIILEN